MTKTLFSMVTIALVAAAGCSSNPDSEPSEQPDPAEVVAGERLFLETRFAEFFYASNGTRVNTPLSVGDPVMDVTQTTGAPLPGPFAGQSMNCRACHLVDEQADFRDGGVRTYADFARRSPIPGRPDGRVTAPRNSPALVNATLPRPIPFFLHFDGEFTSISGLVEGTLTGRNFGWLADERATALSHIATVIRHDDGRGALAAEFGALPYATLLLGSDPSIPDALRIPDGYRLNVDDASDEQVLDAIANLIAAYVNSLVFTQDADGDFAASPYDRFLAKNHLPRQPAAGESDLDYSRRLRTLLAALPQPKFVDLSDGAFALHAQEFVFGPLELHGLQIFLAEQASNDVSVGNCVTCHAAPAFTDFSFHNTGAAQDEYDLIHGVGAFAAIDVPDLAERNAAPEVYLSPSPAHPGALGVFLDVPAPDKPGHTDLGSWNVMGNPAIPAPQAGLEDVLCTSNSIPAAECTATELLPLTIAVFKTPGLRSLGQSAPYIHTGQKDTLEEVIAFYRDVATLAREGTVRNADPELANIDLTLDDVRPLAAFLRALNEDYE